MALALNNLKSVDMPLSKETKPNQTKLLMFDPNVTPSPKEYSPPQKTPPKCIDKVGLIYIYTLADVPRKSTVRFIVQQLKKKKSARKILCLFVFTAGFCCLLRYNI